MTLLLCDLTSLKGILLSIAFLSLSLTATDLGFSPAEQMMEMMTELREGIRTQEHAIASKNSKHISSSADTP
jgi:hypothetical protein